MSKRDPSKGRPKAAFPTTKWGLVAGTRDTCADVAGASLASLCAVYRRPIFVFLTYLGCSTEDAEDLVQELLSDLCEKETFQTLTKPNGKVRSYLMKMAKHAYYSKLRGDNAQKRDARMTVHLDAYDDWELEGDTEDMPGLGSAVFDREWAQTTLESVKEELLATYGGGRHEQCARALFEECLAQRSLTLAELTADLGVTERQARLFKQKFLELFQKAILRKIAVTLPSDCDVRDMEDEKNYLLRCFARAY
jgi:DNA-directed RNA polymerase specialized sigma24 family protein